MIATNRKAALYARFSSDNQRSESIDAQVRAMTEYCRQRHIVIVETYIDEAKSATTDKRPAFQKMIADSSKRIFDTVVVHKLDRFARNRYDSAFYKRELKKNGVSLYSVLENLDDSPESIILESVLEGMSEYYSQNLARETRKGMVETALQCKFTGGKPPLGFDVHPETRKLIINEWEAEAVRIIFRMFADGERHIDIVNELNRLGYKTKKGQKFILTSLYSILTNPKYAGYYVFNRSSEKSVAGTRNTHKLKSQEEIITIEGGCPAIVDQETYDRVQKRITKNQREGCRYNAKECYLLSGKVKCADCERNMHGGRIKSYRNASVFVGYHCNTKQCHNKAIKKEYLEHYVLDLMEREIFNEEAMKKIVQKLNEQKSIEKKDTDPQEQRIRTELHETEDSIQRMIEAISKGLFSAALSEKLEEAETKRNKLTAELTKLESQEEEREISIDPSLIPGQYAVLKLKPKSPQYKEFLQSFIDRIVVGRYTVTIHLKTGLERCPELDSTYTVRRQEIYERGIAAKKGGG